MFHFPTFPPHTLYIQVRVTRHNSCGVTPFGHPRITARLTAPRGLSQPPTSFIGSWYQGIHHVLLKTYTQKPRIKDARVHYADLKQQTRTNPQRRQTRPPQESGRYGHQPAQEKKQPNPTPQRGETCPFSQDPTAHPQPPPTTPTRSTPTTPKEATKSTERRNNQQKIAIVSVPPMSNTAAEHPPAKRRLNPLINDQTARSSLERR